MNTLKDHLRNISRIGSADFITNIEARKIEYIDMLRDYIGDEGSTLSRIIFHLDKREHNSPTKVITADGIYIIECYEELEVRLRNRIHEDVKSKLQLQQISSHLEAVKGKMQSVKLGRKFEKYRKELLAKLHNFILEIKKIPVINKPKILRNQRKLRWLGDIKVLATLFADLNNGQKKGLIPGANGLKERQPSMPKILEANPVDIIKLLVENFVDANNQPLKIDTVSQFVYKEKRQSKTRRIELSYKL